MKIGKIIKVLEDFAPISLQENFDNCGLLIGNAEDETQGALISVDITEQVIQEAIDLGYNLIISHHPLIFKGLKKINNNSYVERCVTLAIKNNIALYAAHTNFDNVYQGVSYKMAEILRLRDLSVLVPKQDNLFKVLTFVPENYLYTVKEAVFEAKGGHIGNYDSCSFTSCGEGSFRALENTQPFVGEQFKIHIEKECRVEFITPFNRLNSVIYAIKESHPYEEPAIDIIQLKNMDNRTGLGVVGNLSQEMSANDFLQEVKKTFKVGCIRHSRLLDKPIKKVALCGGSGSNFISNAKRCKADIYISGDIGYHDFFQADDSIIIADIGHFESEQYIKDIFYEKIKEIFHNFAVQFSKCEENVISYF